MSRKVAIVAVAQTKYEQSKPFVDILELPYEVVTNVVEQTGLEFAEEGGIDATVTCTQDWWDGNTISSMRYMETVGGHLRPAETITNDGAYGVYYALLQILGGHYDVVLVYSGCKESQVVDAKRIENIGFEPFYHRLLGLDFLSAAALQAKRYMYKYGITPEQCAKVVVKNRKNAKNNPYAQAPADLEVSDVLNSPILAYPIRLLDTKPISDGACALILAEEEKAKRITSKPVWIEGVGVCYDSHYLGDRDLADCPALEMAAKQAYHMAGITNPWREIDVGEISESCSYQELLWCEGLGLCGRGEGGKLIDSGRTELGGELPVNPSGGVLSGNPVTVAGLTRVAEAVLQLRGEAGKRQVPGARVALAHGQGGVCGQMQCVTILKK